LLEWVAQNGTVSGFTAPHTAAAFPIDVDSSDLEHARTSAIRILQMLEDSYDVPTAFVRIAFSGAKGFHLLIPMEAIADKTMRPNFAAIFHRMAEKMFIAYDTVDLSIYEPKRIFRITNSVNAKTGLHKVAISHAELCSSIDEIKKLAEKPRDSKAIDVVPLPDIKRCAGIALLFRECETDIKQPPRHDEKGLLTGAGTGSRNEKLVRITGTLISKGIPEEMAMELLEGWNLKNNPPLEIPELMSTVSKQYRLYAKDLSPDTEPEILDMKTMGVNYLTYVKRMETFRVNTGFPALDAKLRSISPGEILCIVGRTSVGKSALLQNIGRNYAVSSGAPVLFFSLEMPDTSVYERSVQLELHKKGYEVEHMFRNDVKAGQVINEMAVALSNFYTIVKPMTIDRIKAYIRYAEANIYNQKTGLVLIDYLGLVKGSGKSIYEEMSKIAREMKDAAKELDVPICYLSQVNKNYGIDQELELGAARDSGAIDEAADYMLGIWRAEESLQNVPGKMRCRVGILKNRKGGLVQFTAWMSKETLSFTIEDADEPSSEKTPF
jgi:energy-coupling factor transporter ATP-binding protein EcfA2